MIAFHDIVVRNQIEVAQRLVKNEDMWITCLLRWFICVIGIVNLLEFDSKLTLFSSNKIAARLIKKYNSAKAQRLMYLNIDREWLFSF